MSYTMTLDMPHEDVPTFTDVDARTSPSSKTGAEFLERLRGDGPFLSDEEMHVFDRVKDYGREVVLA